MLSQVSAIAVVQGLIVQGLTELAVSPNMYDALEEECYPKTPSEHFGITISIMYDDPTLH